MKYTHRARPGNNDWKCWNSKSRFSCPDCGNSKSLDIIKLRPGYRECRICGFKDDEDYWNKTPGMGRWYAKRQAEE